MAMQRAFQDEFQPVKARKSSNTLNSFLCVPFMHENYNAILFLHEHSFQIFPALVFFSPE
uniref:Uncharacterized protein n=1 Tax=Rhizophora mucronata TaxID=61149 RepID=A0A2P2NSA1_RHIMU